MHIRAAAAIPISRFYPNGGPNGFSIVAVQFDQELVIRAGRRGELLAAEIDIAIEMAQYGDIAAGVSANRISHRASSFSTSSIAAL